MVKWYNYITLVFGRKGACIRDFIENGDSMTNITRIDLVPFQSFTYLKVIYEIHNNRNNFFMYRFIIFIILNFITALDPCFLLVISL